MLDKPNQQENMKRTSSKSQLGSGIQLSIPNSPAMSVPISSCDQQSAIRQQNISIHSIQSSKIKNINVSPSQNSLQQILSPQQIMQEDNSHHQQSSKLQLSNQDILKSNNISYFEAGININSLQKSNGSMKCSGSICSIQNQNHLKSSPINLQYNNEGDMNQNIAQFSPYSSIQNTQNSNIIIKNLLQSHNSTQQSNLNMTGQNMIKAIDYMKQLNQDSTKSNTSFNNQQSQQNQLLYSLSQEKSMKMNSQQLSQQLSQPQPKQNQLRKNNSSGNITQLQRSLGSTKGNYLKNKEPHHIRNTSDIRKHKLLCKNDQFTNYSQDKRNIQQLSTPKNSTYTNSYEIISSNQNKYDSQSFHNLPQQQMSPWIVSQNSELQQSQQRDNNLQNIIPLTSQNSIMALQEKRMKIPFQGQTQSASSIKPNKINFPQSSNQLDFQSREDNCHQANSQNLSFISQASNNIKNQNTNNLSATTFSESLSDQKIESNIIGNLSITPFNYNKQDQQNLIKEENQQQTCQNTNLPFNIYDLQPKTQMCKNHSFKSAKHYIVRNQKQQEHYCISCAVLMYTQGYELYQTEESLELNAMKMVDQQQKLQQIQNKKEAIDKLMYVVKEFIPQIQNSHHQMQRTEVDIQKFLDNQERQIDSEFNNLIYELNISRQRQLNQIYQSKQDIRQKYQIAYDLCQKHSRDLNKLHSDILNNYQNILLEFEESKVVMIIQNYFQRWNEVLLQNQAQQKQQHLDYFKVNQDCFQQIKDQLNFLCNLTLEKQQTTYIKLSNNMINRNPLQRSQSKPDIRSNSNQSQKSTQAQQLIQSQSSKSQFQQKELVQPQNQVNTKVRVKSMSIQQNDSKIQKINDYNNLNKYNDLFVQKFQQNHQIQDRKVRSVQESTALPNKSVYISFDNQDAFKCNLEIENKENLDCVNLIQNHSNNNGIPTQKIQQIHQTHHHHRSNTHPHLLQIDLKDIQNQIIEENPLQEQEEQQQKKQLNSQIIEEDCNTFRNKDVHQKSENERRIEQYLDNAIIQAKIEKQKMYNLQSNSLNQENKILSQDGSQNNNLQDISKHLNIYESIYKQNKNLLQTESDIETLVQGQTPNFSNKKKDVSSPPYKKGYDSHNINKEHKELKEFNFQTEEQTYQNEQIQYINQKQENEQKQQENLEQQQQKINEIVEKEKQSRDSSINKKKQFNEMIKNVQHNQLQRNLTCETILRRVSDHQIDISQISQSSTPSHIRSNSNQICNVSIKNSLNSSNNVNNNNMKYIVGFEDQAAIEKQKQTNKQKSLDEINQLNNIIASNEQIGKMAQKQSIQNSLNLQEIRVSQTIVKQDIDQTYDHILFKNFPVDFSQNNEDFANKINQNVANYTTGQFNYPTNEDIYLTTNPIKTTLNSESNHTIESHQKNQVYHPFSQQYDY